MKCSVQLISVCAVSWVVGSAAAQADCGWSAVGSGMNGTVRALTAFDDGGGSDLYATGSFIYAGGELCNGIARWDGTTWSAMGTGLIIGGSSATGAALEVVDFGSGPRLYVGGNFLDAGGMSANSVACWDGSSWSSTNFASGLVIALDVWALKAFDDGGGIGLYAGGPFTSSLGPGNHIARYNGSSWQALGSGTNGFVYAICAFNGDLYVGGSFTSAGGISATAGIARWNGVAWTGVGGGVSGQVYSMTVFDDGSGPALYAGGSFTSAGGVPVSRLARWDGATWSAVGAPPGIFSSVDAMCSFDDGGGRALYVGGNFFNVGGWPEADYIARWNGTAWLSVGTGTDNTVRSLCGYTENDRPVLFAGGAFTEAGDVPASQIARWMCSQDVCRPDLNDDGVLNFFDVQAFLQAFSSHDPVADFTGDGLFNFFDVQSFLQLFSNGC